MPNNNVINGNISLTNPQHRIFTDLHRNRIVVAGRRFGKTTLAEVDLFTESIQYNDSYQIYIGPTFKHAKKMMWLPLLKRYDALGIKYETDKSDLVIRIPRTGSVIRLYGAEAHDRIRGDGVDKAVFDEMQDSTTEAWEASVRPTLSDRNRRKRSLLILTPKGRGHYTYDIYADAMKAENINLWSRFHYTTLQGGNIDDEEIQAARSDLDPRTFRQEYLASFEDYGGLAFVYFSDDPVKGNVRHCPFDPMLPTFMAWDFNAGERPMSVIIVQEKMIAGVLTTLVVKEFVYTNTRTQEMCETVDQFFKSQNFKGTLTIVGDYAGNRRESSASLSDYQIIESNFRNYRGYNVITTPVKSIQDRVNATNSRFMNAKRERRSYVDPSCKKLIKGFMRVTWKDNGSGLTEVKIGDIDPTDAYSYYCYNVHPVHRKERVFR